jgi:hypothetical protein
MGLTTLFFFFTWTGCTPVRATCLTLLSLTLGGLIAGSVVEGVNLSLQLSERAEEHKHSNAQKNNRSFETKIRQGSLLDWSEVDAKLWLLDDASYESVEVFYLSLNCVLTEHYVKYNATHKVCKEVYPYVTEFWTTPLTQLGEQYLDEDNLWDSRIEKKKWAHVHELLILEWKNFFNMIAEAHKKASQESKKSKLACELCRAGSDYEDSFLRSRYWVEGVEFSKAQTQCFEESMLLGVEKLKELASLWAK